MDNTRVFRMAFARVYPHYIARAEKKGTVCGRSSRSPRSSSTFSDCVNSSSFTSFDLVVIVIGRWQMTVFARLPDQQLTVNQ